MRAPAALVLLAAAALSLSGGGIAGRERPERPNVVVLMTDDQTVESMRVMPRVRQALAASGTTFTNSFVSVALCCPSRATFFTGQYAHNHGVLGNIPPHGGYGRLDKLEWLPVWLQRAGYRTMHVGKFLNGYGEDVGSPPTEVPPGWDDWNASVDPSTYRYYGYTLNENGTLRTYERDYSTDLYARRAMDLIDAASGDSRPFFLSVAFLAPHDGAPPDLDDPQGLATPSPAPRHRDTFAFAPLPSSVHASFDEADMSDKPAFLRRRPRLDAARAEAIAENYRQRLESLLAADEAVDAIVEKLRSVGELDNTLIVFTSDNGFFHGEHRIQNGKVLPYEPSIRVPLILRGPGVPDAQVRHQLVTNADLAPTILEATGAVATKPQDGRSLFALLKDPGLEWGRDLLIEGPGGFDVVAFDALRTYRYVYIQYVNGSRELYDLERDPNQLASVHRDPAYADVREELGRRLAALKSCVGPDCGTRPLVRLRVRDCDARVSGPGIEKVEFRAERRSRDRIAPFQAVVLGRSIRARVTTLDGRVVTLDRRLSGCG
jgi:N-acetylglucosamine-6-sulfatase